MLLPRPGIEPSSHTLQGELLTTGPPEKSLHLPILYTIQVYSLKSPGLHCTFLLQVLYSKPIHPRLLYLFPSVTLAQNLSPGGLWASSICHFSIINMLQALSCSGVFSLEMSSFLEHTTPTPTSFASSFLMPVNSQLPECLLQHSPPGSSKFQANFLLFSRFFSLLQGMF